MTPLPRTEADDRKSSDSTAGAVGERTHDGNQAANGRQEEALDGWIADCRPAEYRSGE